MWKCPVDSQECAAREACTNKCGKYDKMSAKEIGDAFQWDKLKIANQRIATLEREMAAATALNESMRAKFENWAMQLETWTEQMDSARVRRSMSRADVVAGIRSILAGRS